MNHVITQQIPVWFLHICFGDSKISILTYIIAYQWWEYCKPTPSKQDHYTTPPPPQKTRKIAWLTLLIYMIFLYILRCMVAMTLELGNQSVRFPTLVLLTDTPSRMLMDLLSDVTTATVNTSLETQGQLVATIECLWWKFTIRIFCQLSAKRSTWVTRMLSYTM